MRIAEWPEPQSRSIGLTAKTLAQEYDEMKWKSADAVDKRIIGWAGPKHSRKNLRAMLSTFESVIHDEAKAKWKPVGLHELVMADQVCGSLPPLFGPFSPLAPE